LKELFGEMNNKRNQIYRRLIFLGILTAFAYTWAGAQTDSVSAKQPNYLGSYLHNGIAMVKSPVKWSKEDWFQFGGSVALVGALVPMDKVLNIPFENWNSSGAEKFGEVGDDVGGLPVQFSITGLALGAGLISGYKPLQYFALDNLQAQLFTGGITFLVKELFQRARPESGMDNFAFYGPFHGGGNVSFFSGHTSLAFSTATMVFLHSKRKWWVGILSYGVAAGVGVSRMQQQKHWSSDVVAGAIMGTIVSGVVYRMQEKRRTAKAPALKILP
jgi:membrane-associated phospholipid phosphatase